jgi:putative ABC transport system permease protein
MIDMAFKNIKRNRSRTIITVVGIMIGVAMIVGLGSFAEGINVFFQSTLEFSAGKVTVQQAGAGGFQSGFSGSDITDEQIAMIESIDGVKEVVPINFFMEGGGMSFGGPQTVVVGIDPENSDIFVGESIGLYSGRELESDDTGYIMTGKEFADNRDLVVGDSVLLKDTEYEVIGIIELSNNVNVDGSAMITVQDMQELLDTDDYSLLYVIPDDIRETERIADDIEDEDESLAAITDKEFARTAADVVGQIRLVMFGMGSISVVAAGLMIFNTMIMAVIERRKEIGVMKAIGATTWAVLRQIITESILIGLIGGIIGVGLGTLAAVGLVIMTDGGIPATVTPALAGLGILFAVLLGAVFGAYPAWQASRVDPVNALRYE